MPRFANLVLSVTVIAGVLFGGSAIDSAMAQVSVRLSSPVNETSRLVNEPTATADTLVLCPAPFLGALQPWLEYRRSQGHRIHVMAPTPSAYGVKRQIREVAAYGNLESLVLIGDTPNANPNSAHFSIPTDYVPATVVHKFGSEPEIATDNSYADIDGDGLPDLAIGRLPVDSPAALARQITKIIKYEATESGQWQRRINLVAGTGGFGQLSDSVIEQTSKRLISDLIPPEYATSMTYASWSSAYCPDPREFADTTLQRLNEGCLFWVYMGHGHPQRLDYVRTPIGGYPILGQKDIARVNCPTGQPIALMLACYTGAFDMPQECLAEQLLNQPGGPIAVVCGTRVTMPCGMSLLSVGLIEEYFGGSRGTMGEMLMVAKRKLVQGNSPSQANASANEQVTKNRLDGVPMNKLDATYESRYRETIAALGQSLVPAGVDVKDEAMEHVHLFHLLGDPLLRVARPGQIELEVQPTNESGLLVVSGTSPHAGEMLVELAYCRDRFQKRPPRRREFNSDADSLAGYRQIYEQSNFRRVTSKTIAVPAGEFQFQLDVPEWARGRCIVRGYLKDGTRRFAMGASEHTIKR